MVDEADLCEKVDQIRAEILKAFQRVLVPRTLDSWTDEDGPVLWWYFPIEEPPYVGTPLDDNFDDRFTHWTPIIIPRLTN